MVVTTMRVSIGLIVNLVKSAVKNYVITSTNTVSFVAAAMIIANILLGSLVINLNHLPMFVMVVMVEENALLLNLFTQPKQHRRNMIVC